jgi:hypothetical protein
VGEYEAALVEEATKKTGLMWIDVPGLPQPRAAWHIWHSTPEHGGAAYLVTGGEGEQPLPGLPEAERVTVTVSSKDKGGRLVSWVAEVSEVEPGTEEWDAVVPVLAKERLNGDQEQAERWAKESYVIRLTPVGETTTDHPAGYAAVRPVPTPATTAGKGPFMIGAKRRKVDK